MEAYSSGDVWISLGVCSNLGELGDSLLETPTDWESDASVSFRAWKKKEESGEENK